MSSEPLEPNQDVIIPRSRDRLGRPVYKAQLTRTDNQSEKVALVRQTAPLPVIFIPGIMGTNLRNKADKSKIWRPPNGLGPWMTCLPQSERYGPGIGEMQRLVKDC